jgi:hypothetical protein
MSTELSSASVTGKSVSNLHCYSTNVRSIMNKLPDFNLFIDFNDPDVIALTETWLCDKVPNSLITCSKYYSVYRRDRLSRHGGGVCLIIKNNLNFSAQQVSLPSEFDCLEILAVDLTDYSSALPFRFVVAYRPPDYASSDNDLFFAALDYLANSCGRFCLTAVAAERILKWGGLSSPFPSPPSLHLPSPPLPLPSLPFPSPPFPSLPPFPSPRREAALPAPRSGAP